MDTLFSDAAEKLFSGICDPAAVRAVEDGGSTETLWRHIEDSGFADALLPQERGGAGLTLAQAFPLLLAAGRHALPVPFAQTMLARAWLHAANAAVPPGGIAIAGFGLRQCGRGVAVGEIPFGRVAQWVLAERDGQAVLLPADAAARSPARSRGSLCAGLQWEALPANAVIHACGPQTCGLSLLSAACMAALLAGSAARVLELTLEYANQRTQFGKSIGRFQAIQNQISVMAERAWAARMAAQLACQGRDWRPQAASAAMGKGVASEAAALIADIGHAVHGAIGVTREHELQLHTRRLREWRLAEGSETYWYGIAGAALLQSRHSALSFLCDTSTAASS